MQNSEGNPQSIADFVGSFIHPSEEDHAVEAAFNFIRPFVENDNTQEKAAAEETAKNLAKPKLKAVVKMLSERVPSTLRKVSATEKSMQKDIAKWLQCSNAKREFLFRSTQNLKDLVGASQRIKISGSKTIDKMIEALANEALGVVPEGIDPNEHVVEGSVALAIRAILQRSFLPHQKGAAREACSMGHILEQPVLEKWIAATAKRGYPVRALKINGAYSAGLVAKQDAPWAKDSIDFVLTVSHRGLDEHQLWGVEVKARVSNKTAADEEAFIEDMGREVHESTEAGEVFKMISAVGERFQVLHHSHVYDFDKVVFMVGDVQSEILQSTIINFDEDLRENYGTVLKDLKELALGWAYKEEQSLPIKLPEDILEIGKSLPQIKDDDALNGTANLWLSLMSKTLPMPSFVRLIPAVCAYWNAIKSGSDTTTKLMDDRVLYPPHVNCETIASTRLILILFVIIHRLIQMITAKDNLDAYPTLAHYRNAASHRSTFHRTYLKVCSVLKSVLEKNIDNNGEYYYNNEEDNDNEGGVEEGGEEGGQTGGTTTRNLRRDRVHGVLPQEMTYGVHLPFLTPKKINKKVEKGEVSESVCNMYNNCTGRLVQVVNSKSKQRCALCTKTTSYYCAGCKSWFCFAQRATDQKKNNNEDLRLLHYNVKGKRHVFFNSCYAEKHQDAWTKEDTATSQVITP